MASGVGGLSGADMRLDAEEPEKSKQQEAEMTNSSVGIFCLLNNKKPVCVYPPAQEVVCFVALFVSTFNL